MRQGDPTPVPPKKTQLQTLSKSQFWLCSVRCEKNSNRVVVHRQQEERRVLLRWLAAGSRHGTALGRTHKPTPKHLGL